MFIAVHHSQHSPELEGSGALGYDWLELTLPGSPIVCTTHHLFMAFDGTIVPICSASHSTLP